MNFDGLCHGLMRGQTEERFN